MTTVLPVIAVWKDHKLEFSKIDESLIDIIESGNNWNILVLRGICDCCNDELKLLCLMENIENKSKQELDELFKKFDGLPHKWLDFINDD